ncbi:hypothetical protein [Bradyrhizobium sp. 2TAF24]|uniref:hypothetical protein n=1 Tax=Bradyrhizobium sp. 2TAF24 TaxID=3233011 RepID=UPI003F91A849
MLKTIATFVILTALASPAMARHQTHHGHRHHAHIHHVHDLIGMNYLHNYGPGPLPDTVAYYDGPLSALCKNGAAAYRGQDHRPHPCN